MHRVTRKRKVGTARAFLGLLILIGVWRTEARAQQVQYFPQVADGGGYTTTLYFAGLGKADANVQVNFFTQTGTALTVQTAMGTSNSFSFALPQNGQVTL